MLNPTRATAMRRSAILRPEQFSAAEFAMFMSLPASMGSEPTTRTTVSLETFSSDSVFCSLITMSGTDGSSTWPCDNSLASAFTKPNTTVFGNARVSTVDAASALTHAPSACRSEEIS